MQLLKLGYAIKLDGRVIGYVTSVANNYVGYYSINEVVSLVNQGYQPENFVVKGSTIRPKVSLEPINLPKVWYLGYNTIPHQLYEFAFRCYKYKYVAKNNVKQEVIAFSNDKEELTKGCRLHFIFDMFPVHGVEDNTFYNIK